MMLHKMDGESRVELLLVKYKTDSLAFILRSLLPKTASSVTKLVRLSH